MKVSWKSIPLGDFVSLQRGHDLPETERKQGNVPVMGSFGLTGYHNQARAKGPGVTVGRSGASFGTVGYCSIDYWPLNTALYVTDFHGNDERFAYYFLKSIDFSPFNSGSAQPSLNRNHIHPIPVSVPPLPEQRAIAHILGSLDDIIELNRRMNDTLEAIARTLFQSWFVNFDPVRAKSEGREPEGMDSETAALFPDAFEDSELGPIPAGWTVADVNAVAELNAWSLRSQDALDVIEYIEISEVNNGNISTISVYNRGEEPSRARRRLRHGDTVMSTVRPERRAYFLAFNPSPNQIASTGFAVVTPQTVPWSFLHAFLSRQEISDFLGHIADGGAYPAINPSVIGQLSLALPPALILHAYHKIASPLYEQMYLNRMESQTISRIRDTLLPKLISGQVRVPEAERLMAAANT